MRLKGLDQVNKNIDGHIFYRNDYTAIARLIGLDGRESAKKIKFSIEMAPTGKKDIKVEFLEKPDFPVLHLLKSIREEIQELDRRGALL